MKIHVNCQICAEEILLEKVLPFWDEYPVDKFVFLDDNSRDKTVEVITDHFGDDAVVIPGRQTLFHEAENRATMLAYSRANDADLVISLDADELLSDNFLNNWDSIVQRAMTKRLFIYQFNVVDSLHMIRQDPSYITNYRDFLFPMNHTGEFDMSLSQYHSPRTPPINLFSAQLDPSEGGFIHLQSINRRFYALKQLWYKTFEHLAYGKSIEAINNAYDPVVNGLKFEEIGVPPGVIGVEWEFDPAVFDDIEKYRCYANYIRYNAPDGLLTFGQEYLK